MDKRTLVERDYSEGAILVKALDDSGFPVYAALWLYNPEKENWRLLLASKSFDNTGPMKAYEHINEVLTSINEQNDAFDISLANISFVRTNDPLIKRLGTAIQTDPTSLTGIRFSRNAIDNYYIEDAYIYRIA